MHSALLSYIRISMTNLRWLFFWGDWVHASSGITLSLPLFHSILSYALSKIHKKTQANLWQVWAQENFKNCNVFVSPASFSKTISVLTDWTWIRSGNNIWKIELQKRTFPHHYLLFMIMRLCYKWSIASLIDLNEAFIFTLFYLSDFHFWSTNSKNWC